MNVPGIFMESLKRKEDIVPYPSVVYDDLGPQVTGIVTIILGKYVKT